MGKNSWYLCVADMSRLRYGRTTYQDTKGGGVVGVGERDVLIEIKECYTLTEVNL